MLGVGKSTWGLKKDKRQRFRNFVSGFLRKQRARPVTNSRARDFGLQEPSSLGGLMNGPKTSKRQSILRCPCHWISLTLTPWRFTQGRHSLGRCSIQIQTGFRCALTRKWLRLAIYYGVVK